MTVHELIMLLIAQDRDDLPVRVEGTYPDLSPDMAIKGVRFEPGDMPFVMIEPE